MVGVTRILLAEAPAQDVTRSACRPGRELIETSHCGGIVYDARVRRLILAVLLVVGCTPSTDGTITRSIREEQGVVFEWAGLYVQFVKRARELEVHAGIAGALLAKGPITPNAKLAVPIGGRPCEVLVHGVFTDSDTDLRVNTVTTRGFQEVQITLRCADGPVPGSPASAPSARALGVLASTVGFLVFGIALGLSWETRASSTLTRRETISLLLGALGAIAAVALAVMIFDGLFVVTSALLFAGGGLIGLGGGATWRKGDRIPGATLVLGAVAGGVAIALWIPLWAWGAPLLALASAGLLGLVLFLIAGAAFERK